MKRILLLIGFVVLMSYPAVSSSYHDNVEGREMATFSLNDGWYKVNVKYYNSSTFTRSTYTLDVKVQSNQVVHIDFGNGGSVHTGYNSSGYLYIGGTINFQKNYQGQIESATARVIINEGSSSKTYDITF